MPFILEHAIDAVVTTNRQGCILWLNHAARHLFGYGMGELVGQDSRCLISPDELPRYDRELCDEANAEGEGVRLETIVQRQDGSRVPVEISLSPMHNSAHGQFICVFRDISAQKQAEQLQRAYTQSLEAAVASLQAEGRGSDAIRTAKTQLLANVSHEIRTPLTAILGFTELLQQSLKEPDDRQAIDTIHRNGDYLLTLVDDLLDLIAIESQELELQIGDCSLSQILAEVYEQMRGKAAAKHLSLELRFHTTMPRAIPADGRRVRQILNNLLGHALRMTATGGVRCEADLNDVETDRPQLRVRVIDTGLGMTAEQIECVFDHFTLAAAPALRRFGGGGLQLAISQQLARLMGGELTVASQVGQGTTFTLTLPIGPLEEVALIDPEQDQRPTHSAAPRDKSRARITGRVLLAEDSPDNQRLLALLLRNAGAEVTIVDNGQAALDAVASTLTTPTAPQFDLVLLDMQLPVLDGFEAAQGLRQLGYDGRILAITAHALPGDRQRCLDAGCDAYLAKPINRDELLRLAASRGSAADLHPA